MPNTYIIKMRRANS